MDEKQKLGEIEALTSMPWWQYLVEDFERIIQQNEAYIFDPKVPDVPTHSLKSIFIVQVNLMKALLNSPNKMRSLLKTIEQNVDE